MGFLLTSSSQFVREIFAPYSEEEHGNSGFLGGGREGLMVFKVPGGAAVPTF